MNKVVSFFIDRTQNISFTAKLSQYLSNRRCKLLLIVLANVLLGTDYCFLQFQTVEDYRPAQHCQMKLRY